MSVIKLVLFIAIFIILIVLLGLITMISFHLRRRIDRLVGYLSIIAIACLIILVMVNISDIAYFLVVERIKLWMQ